VKISREGNSENSVLKILFPFLLSGGLAMGNGGRYGIPFRLAHFEPAPHQAELKERVSD
jgi:hypothetical protein